jgi:xanthine dehydrogenase accessory factor
MEWLDALNELVPSGEPHVIITVLCAQGSTPRDSGTKMIVSPERNFCTIGGGHLEYKAIALAKEMLTQKKEQQRIEHFPLGPRLGQCCGGSATLLFESFAGAQMSVMLFGAGHVGKSLVSILHQLPCSISWVDSRAEEFPAKLPTNVKRIISDDPEHVVSEAGPNTYFIVMTHKHPLDFNIITAALSRNDAKYIGLIGSKTKWERFKLRLQHKGYDAGFYESVRCPIGLSEVPGKRPIEVAVSIAGEIIANYQKTQSVGGTKKGVSWNQLKRHLGTTPEAVIKKELTIKGQGISDEF